MLDYSIRAPLAPSISLGLYGWTGRGESSSMVPEPKSWVQFLPAMHFLPLCVIIPTYLAVLLSTHMARARGRDSHARGGMLDYSIRGLLVPFHITWVLWLDWLGGASSNEYFRVIHGYFSMDRISCAGELLAHIRTVKMYSWEKLFTERLMEIRELEVKHLAVCNCS
jgi:hypothetical protein